MADVDMSGKTVLITGGNSGIGKHTAIGLARLGARVVLTCRNPRKGDLAQAEIRELTGSHSIDTLELDLADFSSIERCARDFEAKYPRLDVLILNAGIVLDRRTTTQEGFETTFGVNHLGHFYLCSLLRERLIASAPARVVVVASEAHRFGGAQTGLDFDDLMQTRKYKAFSAYAQSKLANILFARELAAQLEGQGVTVNSLHPGAVRTELGGKDDIRGLLGRSMFWLARLFMISPERGAETSIYLASSPEVEGQSGGYYAKCKPSTPTAAAQDEAAARRLWQVSTELIEKARRSSAAPAAPPA